MPHFKTIYYFPNSFPQDFKDKSEFFFVFSIIFCSFALRLDWESGIKRSWY